MKHLDLFSGIGGFAFAAKAVWGEDYENVGFVEIDPYCQQLLALRFPEGKVYGDIRQVTADSISNGCQERYKKARGKNSGSEQGRVCKPTGEDSSPSDSELHGPSSPSGKRKASKSQRATGKNGVGESTRGTDLSDGRRIHLLTGGFPCQPFSAAGSRKGTSDDRYLWPEMFRIIRETRPTWIVGENVAGIINMVQSEGEITLEGEADSSGDIQSTSTGEFRKYGVLWRIITDLQDANYNVQVFVIPACAVNAPHRRSRVWIIARNVEDTRCEHGTGTEDSRKPSREVHSEGATSKSERPVSNDGKGSDTNSKSWGNGRQQREVSEEGESVSGSVSGKRHVPNSEEVGLQGCAEDNGSKGAKSYDQLLYGCRGEWNRNWIEVATALCGMDDGLPVGMDGFELSKSKHRVERLKGLGNAIVPQVAAEIFQIIKYVDEYYEKT